MTVAWRPGQGWFSRAAGGLARLAARVCDAGLASAPMARLWAKILATPVATALLLHFAHLLVYRPWPPATAALRLHLLGRAMDWAGVLALISSAALAGVQLRARRGPGGAELELSETPGDPPTPRAPPVSSPPA